MKKNLIKVFILIIIVLLIFLFIILKNVILLPNLYMSNSSLDIETNNKIKTLMLNVIKDRHSTINSINEDELYTEEYRMKYIKYDHSWIAKSLFINIDSDFMKYAKKTNDDEYTTELKMEFPDDWHYFFKIKVVNGRYLISDVEIDP